MPTLLSPQDEERILRMILRDLRREIEGRGPRTTYLSKVKLQKMVFLIAERLDIPITRSWYLYGGYVHSDLLDVDDRGEIDEGLMASYDLDLKPKSCENDVGGIAPEEFGLPSAQYYGEVKTVVTEVYFKKLEDFLEKFYDQAPGFCKKLYQLNSKLSYSTKRLLEGVNCSTVGIDRFIDVPSRVDPLHNQNLLLAQMLAELAKDEFYSRLEEYARSSGDRIPPACQEMTSVGLYDQFQKFVEVFQRYSIKASHDRKLLLELGRVYEFYSMHVWKPVALLFSIATVKGLRADQIREAQLSKLERALRAAPKDIEGFEIMLSKAGSLASSREMKEFYKESYGDGEALAGLLIGALTRG
ncbi:MAG: hypothetical protein ABC596_05980 [Candidatus Methanosuratincola petrocarbonis]